MQPLACLALTIASHGRRMNGAGAWHRRAALRSSSTGEKAANGSRKKRSFKSEHFSGWDLSPLFRRYVVGNIFNMSVS